MTNCGHSFCEQCIVPTFPQPGWRCPLCNQIHNHPASALARNFIAEQLLTAFQAQSTQAPTPPPRKTENSIKSLIERETKIFQGTVL